MLLEGGAVSRESKTLFRKPISEVLENRELLAGGPTLVADINTTSTGPYIVQGSAALGSKTVFVHNDGVHGMEPWSTDGTEAGTLLLKDIRVGAQPSFPADFAVCNGFVFFTAEDGVRGRALWKTDGTPAGTMVIKYDIGPMDFSTIAYGLTAVGDTLYFSGLSGSGVQLWKSDGTPDGTHPFVGTSGGLFNPKLLASVAGSLYVSGTNASTQSGLWRIDGAEVSLITAAETGMPVGNVAAPTVSAGRLFFYASGALRVTSPATNNAIALATNSTASNVSTPFTDVNGVLYFVNRLSSFENELWKTDGTMTGTTLVKGPSQGASFQTLDAITSFNGVAYFVARTVQNGRELWRSDGTSFGTSIVKDINLAGDGFPVEMVDIKFQAAGGRLLFTAENSITGRELWATDGTSAGTVLAKDLRPGTIGSNPQFIKSPANTLYFLASDGVQGSDALWKSDGTAVGTQFVKNIWPGTESSMPSSLTTVGSIKFFTASEVATGRELYKTDGTAGGTSLVKDIRTGTSSSAPHQLTAMNGLLFFVASTSANGAELWKSDGTATGTVLVKDIANGSSGSSPANLVVLNGVLYFTATQASFGTELWRSDGTTAGTVLVKDVNPGTPGSSPSGLMVFGNRLLFSADDGLNGVELWSSDGTAAGTALLRDVAPGANGSSLVLLGQAGSKAYFRADDGVTGSELWCTNGTSSGTAQVKDINLDAGGSTPTLWASIGQMGFFIANDPTAGLSLWRTDGSAAGTWMLTDVSDSYGGPAYSAVSFAAVNNRLYFTRIGMGGAAGDLWLTDGTVGGTRPVFEAYGEGPVNPTSFVAAGSILFFAAARRDSSKREVWRSDGTPDGTFNITYLAPPYFNSAPTQLQYIDQRLYFVDDDGFRGQELYALDPSETSTPSSTAATFFHEPYMQVEVEFDEIVDPRTVSGSDVLAQNLTNGTVVAALTAVISMDGRHVTFTFTRTLGDGVYRFRLASNSISDVFGNLNVDALVYEGPETFFLAGDINRDRSVNFDDLLILAQNYGQTGRTFSQGNVNYSADGLVDFDDLLLLAQRYGTSLFSASPINKRATARSRTADLLN
jgi:ELWxxDGT repeat protein